VSLTKILFVGDDMEAGEVWAYILRQRNYDVVVLGSAQESIDWRSSEICDLIIIDSNSAAFDGVSLIKRLRQEAAIPILFLIPNEDEVTALKAYHASVDDCIYKPINPKIFQEKVASWLRRSWTVPSELLDIIHVGEFQLDPVQRYVRIPNGTATKLSNLEFRLLHILMSRAGKVTTNTFILERVWGFPDDTNILLKNLIYRLRRKIEPDPAHPRHIQTVASGGYIFEA
jgi:two-component system, OmpR family, response regulator RegX3